MNHARKTAAGLSVLNSSAVGHLLPGPYPTRFDPVLVSQVWPSAKDSAVGIHRMIDAPDARLVIAFNQLFDTHIVHLGAFGGDCSLPFNVSGRREGPATPHRPLILDRGDRHWRRRPPIVSRWQGNGSSLWS